MTAAVRLLDVAASTLVSGSDHSSRIACWFTRSALEAVVDDLLLAKGLAPGRASMRSRLTCLEVVFADEPEVAMTAHYAWVRLSEACHQHAYELSPTFIEAEHLLALVRGLGGERGASEAPVTSYK